MIDIQIKARGIKSRRVLQALKKVPRHLFVSDDLQDMAYKDLPLWIGHSQTISQPYVVALMTEAAQIKSTDRVLEIGTGCGYQTAILAHLAREVFTVERIPELAKEARLTLKSLGLENIHFQTGNGFVGWPEEAPFDVIIVTAAPPAVPQALSFQLASGGRLIIPLGEERQELMKYEKKRGRLSGISLGPVRFVPMINSEKPNVRGRRV